MRVLRPGDPFEKLVERELIERADAYRLDELVRVTRAQAIMTGQVTAMCLGIPAEVVRQVGEFVLGGEQDG